MKLKLPVGTQGSALQGFGAVNNNDGTVTVTDAGGIKALLALGAVIVEGIGRQRLIALTGLTPSATLNVNGAITAIAPSPGFFSLLMLSLDLVFSNTGSETVTVSLTPNFSDGTSGTARTFTATGDGTTALTNAQLRSLMADGKDMTSLSVMVKSSINSSTETVAVNASALNL